MLSYLIKNGNNMHKVLAKGILSETNGINIYRGCTHGCIYCDSRSKCYQMDHDFDDVEVKENAPILLENVLMRKKDRFMIGTGSMGDPYIPIEKELELTKKCLEIICKLRFGVAIQTKSNLILRDIDLLKKINEQSKAVVEITLTTYSEKLCKIIEPNVSSTLQRVEVLKKMKEAGIPTIVWLTPLIPFVNDTKENLLGILEYCKEAGVKGIIFFGIGLTLREGNREYFYQEIDKYISGASNLFINKYGNSYQVMSPQDVDLSKLFHNFCESNGIMHDNNLIFDYLREFPIDDKIEQLKLF